MCVCVFAVIVYFLVHLLQNPKHRLKLQDILNHPFTRGATMTSYMSLTGGNNVRSTLLCTFTARSRPSVIGGYMCTGTYIHMYLFWEHSTGNYTYLQTKLRSVDEGFKMQVLVNCCMYIATVGGTGTLGLSILRFLRVVCSRWGYHCMIDVTKHIVCRGMTEHPKWMPVFTPVDASRQLPCLMM